MAESAPFQHASQKSSTHIYLLVIYGHTLMKRRLENIAQCTLHQTKLVLVTKEEQRMAIGWKPVVASIGIQSHFFSSLPKKYSSQVSPSHYWPMSSFCHSLIFKILSYFTFRMPLGTFPTLSAITSLSPLHVHPSV